VNLYAYAGNNPVAFVDPFGLDPCEERATRGLWLCRNIANAKAKLAAMGMGLLNAANTIIDYTTPIVDGIRLSLRRDPRTNTRLSSLDLGLAAASFALGAVPGAGPDDLGKGITKWLGKEAKAIMNEAGDVVLQSRNGLKEIRFDFKNYYPHEAPHVHVIEYRRVKNNKVEIYNERVYPLVK